jgi:putative intracellular protease/amidase
MRLMDLTERDLSQFDALFIPGGHAPMIGVLRNFR